MNILTAKEIERIERRFKNPELMGEEFPRAIATIREYEKALQQAIELGRIGLCSDPFPVTVESRPNSRSWDRAERFPELARYLRALTAPTEEAKNA